MAEQVRSDRGSSQLQGRTTQLPALPTATPPPGAESQQMVPFSMQRGKNSPIGIRNSASMLESDEKMRMLETRLGVTEKSNRALLEEVLRLQNELRVTVARNEQSIRDEKQARMQLDSSIHIVNDLISQLANRIRTAEEKLTEEKSALSSLLSHTKGVEQAVLASQQELQTKKDSQGNKLLDLQTKVMDTQRSRDQLEKTVFTLTDEMRTVRNKLDSQQADFNTIISDLKLRSRRLEEENKLQLDALRKQGDIQSHTEQNTSHLRGQVETRLSELRDVIMDLRSRQDAEINERRTLEQMLQQKVNELNTALGEQNRKREEAMHAMDMIHREKEHTAETEKLKLHSRLTENLDEMNKRLLTKEIKLREEMQQKQQQMEKVYQVEAEKRAEHERKMREDNEMRWAALKQMGDEEMRGVKEALKGERAKNKESVNKLDESISLLEKQLQEQKRLSDKVIAAEIKSRKDHERRTKETIDSVQEKMQVATATLQQAIGGVNGHLANHTDRLRQEMRTMIEASEQGTTRAMTDMDVRVQSMKQRVSGLEQSLDSRISEATAMLAQNIREKVESISLWQDVTSQTIRELNQAIQQMPNDIYSIEEKQKLLKSEMESRVTTEAESRIRDVENLKQEVAMLSQRKQPQVATQQDLQEVQATVRKLAESVQTVKTVLGMKIQSEQKLRISGIEDLQTQINSLKAQIGMHPTVGSVPLYMRTDADAAFDMDSFLQRNEADGIPFRTAGYGKTNMTPDRSEAAPQPTVGSRHGTLNQISQQSPHRNGRQVYSPRRQTPETRMHLATSLKTPTPAPEIEVPLTTEPVYTQQPASKPPTPAADPGIQHEDPYHAKEAPSNPPSPQADNAQPSVLKAETPTNTDPYHAKPQASKPTTPQNGKIRLNETPPPKEPSAKPEDEEEKPDGENPGKNPPQTPKTVRTDGTGAQMFMNQDDVFSDEDDWGPSEYEQDTARDSQADKDEAQKGSKYEKANTARTDNTAPPKDQGDGDTTARDILANI
ncbi:uncharacterized protein LOC143292443 isoform X2 [Babylonia areolata]|uniref:uncharacterized protein LOC143292443 isoform X2 n=1 Tax=Babylonia areolata TaxID=304850 RepID=UPI003FD1B2FA